MYAWVCCIMLEFRNVNAYYGKKEVLHNINFNLSTGCITALIGKNGSGKSTVAAAATYGVRTTGKIFLSDTDISLMSPKDRAKAISLLPQILPFPGITVEKLVTMGRNPYLGITDRMTDSDMEIIEHSLILTGTDKYRHMRLDRLSGGERRRAFVAMILAQDTPLVIMDEPAAYMDADYEAKLMDLLVSMRDDLGKTLLVVMHDLSLAVNVADDILLLDNGQLKFHGSSEECIRSHMIEEVFNVHMRPFADGNGFAYTARQK